MASGGYTLALRVGKNPFSRFASSFVCLPHLHRSPSPPESRRRPTASSNRLTWAPQAMVATVNNLLQPQAQAAWRQLSTGEQLRAATMLLDTVEQGAFVLADNLLKTDIVQENTDNIRESRLASKASAVPPELWRARVPPLLAGVQRKYVGYFLGAFRSGSGARRRSSNLFRRRRRAGKRRTKFPPRCIAPLPTTGTPRHMLLPRQPKNIGLRI